MNADESARSQVPAPLHGIRVVEFTHMVMGPAVGAIAFEDCMVLDGNLHVEIAGRTTMSACLPFSGQPDAVSRIDTRRHLH